MCVSPQTLWIRRRLYVGADKVILLDNDFVALRNLDHLAHVPAPASAHCLCFEHFAGETLLKTLADAEATMMFGAKELGVC